MKLSVLIGSLVLAASPFAASAGTIYSENFDSGVLTGWTISSDKVGVITADDLDYHSAGYSLFTYFDASNGSNQGAGYVHANHAFTVSNPGTYTLDLYAKSAPCQGCTMSYDVLVDGVSLAHTLATDYELRTFSLSSLAAGQHTLTLGMYTDAANSGRFSAHFDDVRIYNDAVEAEAPEPGSIFLLGGAALTLSGRQWSKRKRNTQTDLLS